MTTTTVPVRPFSIERGIHNSTRRFPHKPAAPDRNPTSCHATPKVGRAPEAMSYGDRYRPRNAASETRYRGAATRPEDWRWDGACRSAENAHVRAARQERP